MTNRKFKEIVRPVIKECKASFEVEFFDFIENKALKKKLTKSFKEAEFLKNLSDKLSINFTDAHPLNEIQILHYASIYEAIIDHILENYFKDDIADLLTERILKDFDFCKSIVIKHLDDSKSLYLCKAKNIKKAVDLGLVDSSIHSHIVKLYDYRNHIHILKASKQKHNFTKQLVSTFCNEVSLRNFCNKMEVSMHESI